MRKIAFRIEMLGYNPLKLKEVMLMDICGGQCLKANFALYMTVSVSGHIVFIREVRLGYFTKRLKYNSFRILLMT
jgi:hypothetical protein